MNAISTLRAVGVIVVLASCSHTPAPPLAPRSSSVLVTAAPGSVGSDPRLAIKLDSIVHAGIENRVSPGAAVVVGRHGRIAYMRGYGKIDWAAQAAAVTDSTLYDLASLTKVIATTTAAMILEEDGQLELDRAVREYLPELDDPLKAPITMRMLLTHRSGLKSFHPLYREFRGREQYLKQINLRPLKWAPGTQTDYTDWNLILVQLVVERITQQPLDQFLEKRVFGPLGMRDTRYNPSTVAKTRIAPTEIQQARGGLVWGEVHDENAYALGGVSGHAGLFSSARDLAVFAQMLLNGGEYGGVRIVKPQTIARWTSPDARGSSRALGWDTPSKGSSAGRFLSPWSFGHTGFTGTSIWIDPHADLFIILLTNRVNPSRNNPRIEPLRRAVAETVRQAVRDMALREWEQDTTR